MKNKMIFGAALALSVLSLASCKSSTSEDYNGLRTDKGMVKTEINALFGTTFGNTGSILDDSEHTSSTYFNLYASADDAKSSLFVYNYDLTDYFAENAQHNRNITVSALSYLDSSSIYSSEQTSIMTAAFGTENGVSEKLSDVSFKVTTSTSWTSTYSTSTAYTEGYLKDMKVSLSIVYMPLYVEHYVNSQNVLGAYVFAPVYAAFTNEAGKELTSDSENLWADSTISGIKEIDLSKYLDASGFATDEIAVVTTTETTTVTE